MFSIRTALDAFRRAPLLALLSVTTIGFSLFAFGLFGLVALNIREALRQVDERVEIRAFVADGTPVEALVTAAEAVERYAEVQSVTVVTKEQALARARRELGEFRDVFESEFLPASLDIRMREGHRDPATLRAVAGRLGQIRFVDDVRFGEDWISQLYRLRMIAGVTGIALGLAFAGVAVIIIGATIRMAVLARRKEIAIMRLVGATDGFIRRPFLLEGAIQGALGGGFALAMTWAATQALHRYLSLDTVFFERELAVVGLLCGAAIGLIGSAVSVGRQLREV